MAEESDTEAAQSYDSTSIGEAAVEAPVDSCMEAQTEATTPFQLAPSTAGLSAGGLFTCALTDQGKPFCWGDNSYGALGVGSFTPETSKSPLAVVELSSQVRSLAGGPLAVCAVLDDETVRCWGDSLFGDIVGAGHGEHASMPKPFESTGLGNNIAQVAVGMYFACALTNNGRGKCWGLNSAGQLGTGSSSDSYIAADIADVTEPLVHISASMGGLFACAATASGRLVCWGKNSSGELGTGDNDDRSSPAEVKGLDAKAITVSLGRAHACALLEDGGVACWGSDDKGQLGRGNIGSSSPPARVSGLAPAKSLAVGADHACVVDKSTAAVLCWGSGDLGQFPNAHGPTSPVELVEPGFAATAVSAGYGHSCAMNASRSLRCWGDNSVGQCASGTLSL